jgi:hypothetical protein
MTKREFQPAWNVVAASWSKVSPQDRDTHFFGTLDFDTAQAVFHRASSLFRGSSDRSGSTVICLAEYGVCSRGKRLSSCRGP